MPPSKLDRRNFLKSAALAPAAINASRAPEPIRLQRLAPWEAELSFVLDPPCAVWVVRGDAGADQVQYQSAGYLLQLDWEQPAAGLWNLRFQLHRADNAKFTVHSYSVRARAEFTGIYRLWDYRGGPTELMSGFDAHTRGLASGDKFAQTAAANTGIPLLVATDREGRTRFSLGMLDQVEVTGLRIRGFSLGISERGEGLNFTFEFERPTGYALERTVLTDGARLDTRGLSWFDTIAEYTTWVESTAPIAVRRPPPAAWEPIWNTWYPFGQNINQQIIRENAVLCRQAGITTLCIDAGYNNALTRGMANAADIDQFNAHTGDWVADPGKFPRFRALVDELHQQGHHVTVWVAPFIAGRATRAYTRVRSMLMRSASGSERIYLCPSHPDTPTYLADTFLNLARDYDLDGFWLDFMDGLHEPCHATHPHATPSPGEGYNRCLAAVRDAVLGWKPGFQIETRMKMSNINVKQFASTLETYDMPFDFDLNRGYGLVMRSFAGRVAAKLDPCQWHIHESDMNVAKSCATVTFAGVPVFGVDFRLLRESHRKVVTAWMRFYRRHQADFARADCRPVGFNVHFPQFVAHTGSKSFHYIGSAATAPAPAHNSREIYTANASDNRRITLVLDGVEPGAWRKQIFDCFLEPRTETTISIERPTLALDERIPEGGMLVLSRP